jgi:hypothetical protein
MSALHAFELGVLLGAVVIAAAFYFRHRLVSKAKSALDKVG